MSSPADKPSTSHTADAPQQNVGHPTEGGAALHSETHLGTVGDSSANQHWSQMTGGGAAGADQGAGVSHHDGGQSGASGSIDFSSASDIYAASAGAEAHAGMDSSAAAGGLNGGAYSADGQVSSANADQGALDSSLTPSSTASLYGDGSAAGASHAAGDKGGHPGADVSRYSGSDGGSALPQSVGGSDSAFSAAGGDREIASGSSEQSGPPEIKLPTAEQVANAPVEQLQAMSRDSRQALQNYVQGQGDAIPSLALHGTSASSGHSLSNYNQNGEIWVAGPNPDRKGLGTQRYVGDLSVSAKTAMGYADKRGDSSGNGPGPVLVYDAGNQPQAWSKTSYSYGGRSVDGNSTNDEAKFGKLDLSQAKLLGTIPREQLDGLKQQFAPLNDALLAKQSDILSAPGAPDQSKVDDLLARVQVVNKLHRDSEVRAVLNVVAQFGSQQ